MPPPQGPQKPRRSAGLRRIRGPWRVAVVEASMAPAIEPGDWLLVDPTSVRWPRRGSVVVFRETRPTEPVDVHKKNHVLLHERRRPSRGAASGPKVGSTSSQSPGSMAGAMLASTTATRHGPRMRRSPADRRGFCDPWGVGGIGPVVSAPDPWLSRADRLPCLLARRRSPSSGVDLVDDVEQLRAVGRSTDALTFGLLGGVPEQLVQVRDLSTCSGLK